MAWFRVVGCGRIGGDVGSGGGSQKGMHPTWGLFGGIQVLGVF